jgi:hypothetical protein
MEKDILGDTEVSGEVPDTSITEACMAFSAIWKPCSFCSSSSIKWQGGYQNGKIDKAQNHKA